MNFNIRGTKLEAPKNILRLCKDSKLEQLCSQTNPQDDSVEVDYDFESFKVMIDFIAAGFKGIPKSSKKRKDVNRTLDFWGIRADQADFELEDNQSEYED